ncbi:hypothetical protein APSETT445_001196 [Aspergillus pseudonomiae]
MATQGKIRALKYFKLELDPEARAKLKALRSDTESSRSFVRNHGTRSAVVGEYEANRNAKDVCTDYLQAIYLAALEQINNLWVPVPQAAAIHTLSQAHMVQSVRPGNHYIIYDAGGGTVDLITYCVKRNEPLELVESIPGTGEACGSILLSRAFEDFLKHSNKLNKARRRFDVEVTTLINRSRHCPELGIVMVGGFGQNDYLYKRVKHEFEHLATVTRPPDAWASITLGALCWGMNHETVTARKLPRCYGQQVYVKYNPDCGYPSVPHPVTGEPSHEAMQWFVEVSRREEARLLASGRTEKVPTKS